MIKFFLFRTLISIQPTNGFITFVTDKFTFIFIKFSFEFVILNGGFHIETIGFQIIFAHDSFTSRFIFVSKLLSVVDHLFNFFLGQTTFVIGDGDLVLLAWRLVHGSHVQDSIGIDVKSHLDLGYSARSRRYAGQFKLAEQVVILGHCSFTFKYLNQDSGLVVRISSEGLSLFGWNRCVPLDQGCHDTSSGFNTQAQGCDIQKQQILNSFRLIALQNGSLNSCSISYGFIRIDGFVQFFAIEEILQQFLDLGNSSTSADQDDFMNIRLVHLGITQCAFHRFHGTSEEIGAQFFKSGSSYRSVEINAFEKRVDFYKETIALVSKLPLEGFV